MKKKYIEPKYEVVVFSNEEIFTVVSSACPDDCGNCFYLVCQPKDVIIGGG